MESPLSGDDTGRLLFVRPSVVEVLRAGVLSARTHARIWVKAFGYLVAVEAALNLLSEWLGAGSVAPLFRVAVLVGVIGYLVPSVWASQLGEPLNKAEMKTFLAARMDSLTSLGLTTGFLLGMAAIGLGFGLIPVSDAWKSGWSWPVVGIGLLFAAVVLRVGVALLIVAPAGVVEHLKWSAAFRRAWRLSRRSIGVLGVLVVLGVLIQLGGAVGIAVILSEDSVSDWIFLIVIAPVTSSILNMWWVATSGPAYAIARERAQGYPRTGAEDDFAKLFQNPDATS